MSAQALLVELVTEELPPKSLKKLGDAFSEHIFKQLVSFGLVLPETPYRSFASPRRLAILIDSVLAQAPDVLVTEKLLPVSIALTPEGDASAPLLKKLASLGVPNTSLTELVRQGEGKNTSFYIHLNKKGMDLTAGLQEALHVTISKLPIAKTMHYQLFPGTKNEVPVQFVRPAHLLTALHGTQIVPVTILGLSAGRHTVGHRFLSQGSLQIPQATAYESVLQEHGHVIPNFEDRLQRIKEQLTKEAHGALVLMPQPLLEEVAALVEWPCVYACTFEKEFLEVPQECLILTMQTNQKYFALTNANHQLINRFLIVSNIATPTPEAIISGNERVVRPRLADAQFFFQQDQKTPLIERFEQLTKVVYHNKLGNQKERMARIGQIAKIVSETLSESFSDSAAQTAHYIDLCARGAQLIKADLLTDMVAEFPELQGIMGSYYAKHDGENPEIVAACAEHYLPRFGGDRLPSSRVGLVLALADKLETIVGIWGIGLAPTGEKDPFALRRHALGVCRLIIENDLPINLIPLLEQVKKQFDFAEVQHNADLSHILQFIKDRLRAYVREFEHTTFSTEEIEAVLANVTGQFKSIPQKLLAVHSFQELPQAGILAAANKRINNILKKNAHDPMRQIDQQLLELPAEKNLFAAMQALVPRLDAALLQQDFAASLHSLIEVCEPVEVFFKDVMVIDPDPLKRENRLAILHQLHQQFNQVADLSQLAQ